MDEREFYRLWTGLTHAQRRYAMELVEANTKAEAARAAGLAPNTVYTFPEPVRRCAAYLQAQQALVGNRLDRIERQLSEIGETMSEARELPMPSVFEESQAPGSDEYNRPMAQFTTEGQRALELLGNAGGDMSEADMRAWIVEQVEGMSGAELTRVVATMQAVTGALLGDESAAKRRTIRGMREYIAANTELTEEDVKRLKRGALERLVGSIGDPLDGEELTMPSVWEEEDPA